MSSFSEHNGLPGIRHSLKRVTEQAVSPRNLDDHARPTQARKHRTSIGAVTTQRGSTGPCAIEGAIGTLRRMTISGDEADIFGALEQH